MRFRQSIIVALDGASLFDDLRPGEAEAAFGGALVLPSQPIGAVTPWSARLGIKGPSRLLKALVISIALLLLWMAVFTDDKVIRGTGRVLPSTQNQSCSIWKAASANPPSGAGRSGQATWSRSARRPRCCGSN